MDRIEALQIMLELSPGSKKPSRSATGYLDEAARHSLAYQVVYYMLEDEIKKSEQNEAEMYETALFARRLELMKEASAINETLGRTQSPYRNRIRNDWEERERKKALCSCGVLS